MPTVKVREIALNVKEVKAEKKNENGTPEQEQQPSLEQLAHESQEVPLWASAGEMPTTVLRADAAPQDVEEAPMQRAAGMAAGEASSGQRSPYEFSAYAVQQAEDMARARSYTVSERAHQMTTLLPDTPSAFSRPLQPAMRDAASMAGHALERDQDRLEYEGKITGEAKRVVRKMPWEV